ncbi:response regulator transcription factor [Blautia liquoris]|uniref:Stage 0 sporulation protein A homolog n=1 Tax=Blautia liquoris TaxID=2779518 RepID=A0A7M2RIX7_9FIRM|nr:response regulator transcription factor [Blautia liquoris]QOV20283.1 response regulator transcription factor [Blautia liquoris]
MFKIMLVEDDLTITEVLERQLKKWGYQVLAVEDFNRVMEQFERDQPDLVLMDISLPSYNGFYWCTEIRKISKTPILFISSASDDMNLVMAINMGADDFIAKPFNLDVITAKIQAMLRRTYDFTQEAEELEAGGVTLSLLDNTISKDGQTLELTKNEFKILKILMEEAGQIVSRDEIMKELWDTDHFIDDNTLTVNVTRLRKRLEEAGVVDFIETKKGIGYRIAKKEDE